MVTLKELYTTLRLLRDMNLHVDDKLLKAADDIEKDNQRGYSAGIQPNYQVTNSGFSMCPCTCVEYHIGEPQSVALSLKTKICEIIDAKTLFLRSSSSFSSFESQLQLSLMRQQCTFNNPTNGLCVSLPDGMEIMHKEAICIFSDVLRKKVLTVFRRLVLNMAVSTLSAKTYIHEFLASMAA